MVFGVAGQARPGHVGYLAGKYRDGAYSDLWTDVARCAPGTFVAYAPACSCGWRGGPQPATAVGRITCHRAWAHGHLSSSDTEPATLIR
jgi:hypothetical protein